MRDQQNDYVGNMTDCRPAWLNHSRTYPAPDHRLTYTCPLSIVMLKLFFVCEATQRTWPDHRPGRHQQSNHPWA